jgi:hypothetical protein
LVVEAPGRLEEEVGEMEAFRSSRQEEGVLYDRRSFRTSSKIILYENVLLGVEHFKSKGDARALKMALNLKN